MASSRVSKFTLITSFGRSCYFSSFKQCIPMCALIIGSRGKDIRRWSLRRPHRFFVVLVVPFLGLTPTV